MTYPAGCSAHDGEISSSICRLGSTSSRRSIVVFGDSHAQMWMPAILDMAQKDGWVVVPLGKSACTPANWIQTFHQRSAECHSWYHWALRELRTLHPDVTLVGGSYSGSQGTALDAVVSTLSSFAKTVHAASGRIVVIGDVDGVNREPVDCLLASNATMATCTTTWPAQHYDANDQVASLANAGAYRFLPTTSWFCSGLQCPMVIGHTIVYTDTTHITTTYAQGLATPFRLAFRQAIRGATGQ